MPSHCAAMTMKNIKESRAVRCPSGRHEDICWALTWVSGSHGVAHVTGHELIPSTSHPGQRGARHGTSGTGALCGCGWCQQTVCPVYLCQVVLPSLDVGVLLSQSLNPAGGMRVLWGARRRTPLLVVGLCWGGDPIEVRPV